MKTNNAMLKWTVMAGLSLVSAAAIANTGTVSQLAGTLSVQKADGSVRLLSQKSEIRSGDTLSTQKDSFAEIKFADGAKVTLKPNTSIKIESFMYQEAEPQNDSFVYSLVKGGLRAVTGLLGHRNPDAYRLGTATATIGIRGTTFQAHDCTQDMDGCPENAEKAVYVSVQDGEISVTNKAGTERYLAGQFGLIDSPERRPRHLSTDPGLMFTPPQSWVQSFTGGSAVNSGRSLECVVRR